MEHEHEQQQDQSIVDEIDKTSKIDDQEQDNQTFTIDEINQMIEHQKQKQNELFKKEVLLTLKEHELEDWAEFLNANSIEELNVKITKLKSILKDKKIENSHVPDKHKQTDAYSHAKSNGDTLGMIKALLIKN